MQLYQQNNDIPRIFQDHFFHGQMLVFKKKRNQKTNQTSNWIIIKRSNRYDKNAEPAKYVIYSVYLEMYLTKGVHTLKKYIHLQQFTNCCWTQSQEKIYPPNNVNLLVLTWYVIHSMLPLSGVWSE